MKHSYQIHLFMNPFPSRWVHLDGTKYFAVHVFEFDSLKMTSLKNVTDLNCVLGYGVSCFLQSNPNHIAIMVLLA